MTFDAKAYRSAYGKTQKWKDYRRNWYLENREHVNEYNKNNYAINIESRRVTRKYNNKKNRLEIIELLGGVCKHCGFSDTRALQIDHVNGGGTKERKSFGHSASSLFRKVRESIEAGSFEYQLLCANCNWIKREENCELYKGVAA